MAKADAISGAGIQGDDISNKTGKGVKEQKVVEAFVNISKIQYDFLTKTLDVHPRGVMAAPGMSVPHSHTFNPPEVIKTLTKYAKLKLS